MAEETYWDEDSGCFIGVDSGEPYMDEEGTESAYSDD